MNLAGMPIESKEANIEQRKSSKRSEAIEQQKMGFRESDQRGEKVMYRRASLECRLGPG
jgi:hypothetical protein